MLIILPLLAFVLVTLDLLGLQDRRGESLAGLRGAFLETTAFLGVYLLLFSEGLSLFKALSQPWAAACWSLLIVAAGWLGWRKGLLAGGWRRLRSKLPHPDWLDWTAGAILSILLILLFLTAVISPSNNDDSLQYHMSRVVHWAEDQSLAHYATAYEPQLFSPIWAETAILNARLLWGDDKLANLIQWACLVGVIVAASATAKLFGAGRKGQWAAAAFSASLPMAILQSTSTQADLATGFWLVCLLYFIVLSVKRDLFPEELLALAICLGLGLLTKGTFYPFALLPMLYFLIVQFIRRKFWTVIARGALIAGIAIALNFGFWTRNVITFGGPLGPPGWISAKTGSSYFSLGALAGSLTRNVVRNLATPGDRLNNRVASWLQSTFKSIDPQMAGFTLTWGWNHEDLAGNPIHVVLIAATLILILVLRRRINLRVIIPYTLVVLGLYVLFSAFVSSGEFDARYQIPFFAAWAPLFGITLEAADKRWLPSAGALGLLVIAFPWALFNRTRPLIAMRPSHDPYTIPCLAGCTAGSILNEPSAHVLFAGWLFLEEPYTQATTVLRQSTCRSVGLQLDSHSLEYTFWWLLDAPQSGFRLETIYTYPELERYLDPAFKPCAIICDICRGKKYLHGLSLVSDYTGQVQLYMGPDYSPNP